ncbi:MAG TPA: class I SAM-dependent methyltransferase [Methylomirabilota bacterium]|nr:class I SAM-dependent methyltransferase [Methylomirabilota bacterium]
MRVVERCPLCGDSGLRPYAMNAWAPTALHFAQARCNGCGLLISQPQASEAEMESYYRRAYYEDRWPDPEAVWKENTALYRRHELPLMQRLWADWAPPAGGAVAEIGCGYGVFLGLLRELGYRASGCDLSPRAVACCRSRGLDVVEGRVPGVPLPREAFDVVISMHVIEHLPDPRGFVKEMVSLARPGGVVAVVTEDAWISQYAWDRLRARLRGRIPRFRSSTDHTFVFRADHLQTLMAEAGCVEMRICAFTHRPGGETLHWRLYKGLFRLLDRVLGHGEFLMAVGRRGAGP